VLPLGKWRPYHGHDDDDDDDDDDDEALPALRRKLLQLRSYPDSIAFVLLHVP
jgi:hypothetical protein